MYCDNCGQQISNDARFCSHCGKAQNKPKKATIKPWLWGFVILCTIIALGNLPSTGDKPKTATEPVPSISDIPENGWHTESGNSYYLSDGKKYVGFWEIDGNYYYFNNDGILQKGTTVEDDDGFKARVDSNGKVTKICYPQVQGTWSAEDFHYGYNGRASVIEFNEPLKDCISADFYIEAEGLYGSSVDCAWRIHAKINGQWKEITKSSYSGTSTSVPIQFSTPTTIEAITAHPTVTGNASYSSYFELRNVWCNPN